MEMIFSPSAAYLVIQEVRRSYKCKVSVGRDNGGKLYVLNQLSDRRLIARYLNTFDASFTDYVESFVHNGNYYIVFEHHEGDMLGAARAASPSEALAVCEAVCFAALSENVPDAFLCQLISAECIVMRGGEAKFNKFFTLLEEDYDGAYTAQKLAAELTAYIEDSGFNPVQRKTLDKFINRLGKPFDSLMGLYLYVRDFRKAYKPMGTVEIIKSEWKKLVTFITERLQKLLFYAAAASAVLASLLILQSSLAAPDEGEMLIKQAGGYTLSERGSIDEDKLGKTE